MKNKILLIITIINAAIFLPFIGILKSFSVPFHYGINGNPDYFGNKWFLTVFPLMAFIFALCTYIYRKKLGQTPNQKSEDGFFYAFTAFIIGLGWTSPLKTITVGNSSLRVVNYYIIFGLGFLFVYMGYLMKGLKQNKFFGVRTKYTLKNETVWNKTHNLSSKLGIVGGIILIFSGILSILFNTLSISFAGLIIAIVLCAFIPMFYSKKISENQH